MACGLWLVPSCLNLGSFVFMLWALVKIERWDWNGLWSCGAVWLRHWMGIGGCGLKVAAHSLLVVVRSLGLGTRSLGLGNLYFGL